MPLPTTANVDRPRALGYHARLDDLYLRLIANQDVGTPRIESIRPEATRVDTGQTPEDFVSEFGQTFSRSRFAGGEGLGFAHREESETDRFWRSEGIDVQLPDPGDRHAIRLLHGIESISGIFFQARVDLVTDGESLWGRIGDNFLVRRTDDPLADSPTFVDDDPTSGMSGNERVEGLAMLGGQIHASVNTSGSSTNDGVYRKSGLTFSWSQWSTLANPYKVWAVKQRIIASTQEANSRELYEVRADDGSVLLATLPESGIPGHPEWVDVVDGGTHILAAGEDGHIYAFTANDNADMQLAAQTSIPFETPSTLAAFGGIILIATRRSAGDGPFDQMARLWRADLASNGSLINLNLIRQWGSSDPPSAGIDSMASDGASVLIGLYDARESGLEDDVWSGLWRYDLATGGLVEHLRGLEDSSTDQVWDILFIGRKAFFNPNDGNLYRESDDTYRSSGWLMTPAADFFTALDKSWLRIDVEADFPAGTSAEVSYATDLDAMDDPASSLWTSAGTLDPSSTSHVLDIAGTKSRFLVLMVTLNANSAQDETPQVYSVSVTANVIGEEVAITLPVNVSDQIELPGKRRHNIRGLGEKVYQELRSRVGESVEMELFSPAETIRGTVWKVDAPVVSVDVTGSRTLVCNVEVRGVGG